LIGKPKIMEVTMGKSPESVQTVVAVTSRNSWGKGENVVDALKNAQVHLLAHYESDDEPVQVSLSAYNCEQDKIHVSPIDGGISYPSESTSINLGLFKVSELTHPADVLLGAMGIYDRGTKGKDHQTADRIEELAYKLEEEECEAQDKARQEKAKLEKTNA
jgi:hypothetical protein